MTRFFEISRCAFAQLSAIAANGAVDTDTLRSIVPPDAIVAWFDALQELLDRSFVIRVEAKDRFLYRVTAIGEQFVDGHAVSARGKVAS